MLSESFPWGPILDIEDDRIMKIDTDFKYLIIKAEIRNILIKQNTNLSTNFNAAGCILYFDYIL